MRSFTFSRCFWLCLLLTCFLLSGATFAQEVDLKPTYVTARLFVVLLPHGGELPSDQVFRLRTAAQADDEKWAKNIQKAYSDAAYCGLLRTQQLRLIMAPKPSVLLVGDPNQPHIEAQFLLAQGLRDDDTINSTAIVDVNFYAGSKVVAPIPMSMANQGFEVNPENTYFFTANGLKLKSDVYTVYFRGRSYAPVLEQFDHYLVVSLTIEDGKHAPFTFDPAQSAELQKKATKKVEPQWPNDITQNGFFGQVQVKVNIGADGKVTEAHLWESTMPEGNIYALKAARQWEFPASELAGINAPASALLTFSIAPPAPPKAPEKAPEKTPEKAAPAGTKSKTTTTKPPVKRRKP